jgi:hypothetical protein
MFGAVPTIWPGRLSQDGGHAAAFGGRFAHPTLFAG